MRVKLEDVCERGSSNIKQSDISKNEGSYEIYGASGLVGKVNFYHRDKPYVAVVKDGAGIGRTMFLHGKTSIIGTMQYLIPKDNILPKYLYYVVRYMNLSKYFTGATIPHIYYRDYKNEEFNLSPINNQKIIISRLEALECIIESRMDELKKLDNLIKARFVEMFGASGANPKGWNEIKLGEVCSLQNGYAFKSSDYINKSSVLNCRMSNIRPDGGFDAEYHPKYLPDEYWDKCSGYRLFDGDVIIAMTDMASDPKILGVPTIVSTNGKKFLLNQRVGKLSFLHDDRMNRVYLMHSLGQKYIRKELAKSAAGSTQINVGKPAILNINIYDPPRSLQDQFATFVVQVDKSKFALQNSIISLMNLWYNINNMFCERMYGEA